MYFEPCAIRQVYRGADCMVIASYWTGDSVVGTGLLCLLLYLLCYAAVHIKFTYYAQNYAQK